MSTGRIKFENMDEEEDTRSTIHLYRNEDSQIDRKPCIVSLEAADCIEVSSSEEDADLTPSRVRVRRRKSSQYYTRVKDRIYLKDVETQTDIATETVNKVDFGVNTDSAIEKNDIAVNTDNVVTTDMCVNVDFDELLLNTGNADDVSKVMEVDEVDNSNVNVDSSQKELTTPSSKKLYQCKICSCYYRGFNLIQRHSQSEHNKLISIKHPEVTFNPKCKYCASVYNFETYNQHIRSKHSDKLTKNSTKNNCTVPYRCTICDKTFLTYREGNKHRKAVHANADKKFVLRKIKEPSNTENPSQSNSNTVQAEKPRSTTPHRVPIPKSVLFQCPKCELNFYSYRCGLRHKITCEKGENKGIIVNCTKCNRKILKIHIQGHYRQHEMSNEFQTLPISEGIKDKILYRCMMCKVCLDDRSSKRHFQDRCNMSIGIPCTTCNLKIEKNCMPKHRDAHGVMGLTREQIILVDVCD